jgi:hypothetical protein
MLSPVRYTAPFATGEPLRPPRMVGKAVGQIRSACPALSIRDPEVIETHVPLSKAAVGAMLNIERHAPNTWVRCAQPHKSGTSTAVE